VFLAAVYTSPGYSWNDVGVIALLKFRHKSLMAGDLIAKHTFWNSVVSNHSGTIQLNLLHVNEFEISAPQCSTYSPAGNGNALDNVVFIGRPDCQKSLL
jgi:hypothetical protein